MNVYCPGYGMKSAVDTEELLSCSILAEKAWVCQHMLLEHAKSLGQVLVLFNELELIC